MDTSGSGPDPNEDPKNNSSNGNDNDNNNNSSSGHENEEDVKDFVEDPISETQPGNYIDDIIRWQLTNVNILDSNYARAFFDAKVWDDKEKKYVRNKSKINSLAEKRAEVIKQYIADFEKEDEDVIYSLDEERCLKDEDLAKAIETFQLAEEKAKETEARLVMALKPRFENTKSVSLEDYEILTKYVALPRPQLVGAKIVDAVDWEIWEKKFKEFVEKKNYKALQKEIYEFWVCRHLYNNMVTQLILMKLHAQAQGLTFVTTDKQRKLALEKEKPNGNENSDPKTTSSTGNESKPVVANSREKPKKPVVSTEGTLSDSDDDKRHEETKKTGNKSRKIIKESEESESDDDSKSNTNDNPKTDDAKDPGIYVEITFNKETKEFTVKKTKPGNQKMYNPSADTLDWDSKLSKAKITPLKLLLPTEIIKTDASGNLSFNIPLPV